MKAGGGQRLLLATEALHFADPGEDYVNLVNGKVVSYGKPGGTKPTLNTTNAAAPTLKYLHGPLHEVAEGAFQGQGFGGEGAGGREGAGVFLLAIVGVWGNLDP